MAQTRIMRQDISINEQQRSLLSSIVLFHNLQCWFCYENGYYFMYNLKENKKLAEGNVAKDVRQSCSIQDNQIAYISHEDQMLYLLDISKGVSEIIIDPNFKVQLPTKALTQIEPANKDESLLNVELFSMEESNFLVVSEQAVSDKRSFVLTCYNMGFMSTERSNAFTQITIQPDGVFFVKAAPVDKRDTIVVCNLNYQDQPLTFWIWNFMLKEQGYRKVVVDPLKLNGTIVDFSSWLQPQQIAFWINISNSGKPYLVVYDTKLGLLNNKGGSGDQQQQQQITLSTQMQNDEEQKNTVVEDQQLLEQQKQQQQQLLQQMEAPLQTATQAEPPIFPSKSLEIKERQLTMFGEEDWIFQEVVDVDPKAKKVIIIKIGDNVTYEVIDCSTWKVDFTQLIDESEWSVVRSLNKKYFLEYNQEYEGDGAEDETESQQQQNKQTNEEAIQNKKINLRLNFFTISVVGLLHVLNQSKLTTQYGEEVAKDVIDMLAIKN